MKEDFSKPKTSEVQVGNMHPLDWYDVSSFIWIFLFFTHICNVHTCLNKLCVKCISEQYCFQSERKEILRRLNDNLKSKEEDEQEAAPVGEPGHVPEPCQPVTDERPQSGGDRRRWEPAAPPVLSVAQCTLEDTCSTMAGTNRKSELKICSIGRKTVLHSFILFFLSYQCLRQCLLRRVLSLVVTGRSGSLVMFRLLWLTRLWRTPVSLQQVSFYLYMHLTMHLTIYTSMLYFGFFSD